jgi:hypothetical protein
LRWKLVGAVGIQRAENVFQLIDLARELRIVLAKFAYDVDYLVEFVCQLGLVGDEVFDDIRIADDAHADDRQLGVRSKVGFAVAAPKFHGGAE